MLNLKRLFACFRPLIRDDELIKFQRFESNGSCIFPLSAVNNHHDDGVVSLESAKIYSNLVMVEVQCEY